MLAYQRRVFAAIGRILGPRCSRAHVEDLAQETFLKALRALPRFDPSGPARVSTWLLTIATRVALSELRRKRVEIDPSNTVPNTDLGADAQHPQDPQDPQDPYAQLDARRTLSQIAQALTPEQRAVFVLRDIHGLTETEVAAALDLDVSAAKSRLHRARARLRRALTEANHD